MFTIDTESPSVKANTFMNTQNEQAMTSIQSNEFTVEKLQELGLKLVDIPAIKDIASRINPENRSSVTEFGRAVSEHTQSHSDQLLEQVRNKDLENAGKKLSEVVSIARSLNMHALSNNRSKFPIIGPWIDKIKLKTYNLKGQFESSKEQIDHLVAEVNVTQKGLAERNTLLENMFGSVMEEHHLLGMHIAAGKLRLQELRVIADERRENAKSTTDTQEVADLDALIASLNIRIGNLIVLQQSALQTLPQIRVIQKSNEVLVDKFHTVRTVTVPTWTRQLSLQLGLNEQKNAVQLAEAIDDTTNELLRGNAELLHKNAVQTAKANQRLVIDTDTLQKVQDNLIRTVEDVLQIQRDGVEQRQQAERQIVGMREQIRKKLSQAAVK